MGITRGPLSAQFSADSASATVTWTGTQPAAGSKVLVWVQVHSSSITSVADNGTTPRTFTQDAHNAGGGQIYLFRADNITLPGAGNYAVTVTLSATDTVDAGGIAYTGVAAGGPAASNSNTATSTAVTTGSVTPAGSGALYFAAFSDDSGLGTETITLNSTPAFTQQFAVTNGVSFWCCACADAITSGAQNPSWTLGDSAGWGAAIATYDAVPAGPPSPFTLPRKPSRGASSARRGSSRGSAGAPRAFVPPPVPSWDPSGSYTLVFDDEFTGTSLNPVWWGQAWQASTGTSPPVDTGDETAGYSSAQVSVSGGTLNLQLVNSPITVGGHTYPNTAGCVTTDTDSGTGGTTGFTFQYGAVEARVFIPPHTGDSKVPNWPSWWMVNPATQQGGGTYLEIDLMEGLGGSSAFHVHWATGTANQGSIGVWIGPQTGWHTIGANWTASQIDFYYDGLPAGTLPEPQSLGTADLMLIFINTIANALPVGVAGPNQTPTTEQVDWVRVWTAGPARTVPAFSALFDNFAGSSTLQTLWGGSTVAANFGNVSIGSGVATVPADAVGGEALTSGSVYNLTGSYLYAEVTVATGTGCKTGFQANNASGSPNPVLDGIPAQTFGAAVTWEYSQASGNLTAILSQGTTDTTVGSVTYSATTHKWLRIRESAGTLFWDTSPDGSSWVNRFSHAYTISIARLFANIYTIAGSNESTVATVAQFNGGAAPAVPAVPASRPARGTPAARRGTSRRQAGAPYVFVPVIPAKFTLPARPSRGAMAARRGTSRGSAGAPRVFVPPPVPSPFTLPRKPARGAMAARKGAWRGSTGAPWAPPVVTVVNQWSGTFAQPGTFGPTPPALQSVVVPLTPAASAGGGSGLPTPGNWLFCIAGWRQASTAVPVTIGVADDIHSWWRPSSPSPGAALTRAVIWYTANLARQPGCVYAAPDGAVAGLAVLVIEVSGIGPWDNLTGLATGYDPASGSITLSLS